MKQFFTWRSAILDSDLSFTTKGVLLILSTYMNDHGEGAYPSQKTLARKGTVSQRTIRDHIKIAVEKGWLVKRKHGYGDQRNNQNEYHIAFPKQEAGEQDAPASESEKQGNEVPKQGNVVPQAGEYDDQKQGQEVPPNTPMNSPMNSPVTLGEENEQQNQSQTNSSEKGKENGTAQCTIDEIINPDSEIPADFRAIAEWEGLADPEYEFLRWVNWWIGKGGRHAGRRGWLAIWENRVRKIVNGGHDAGRDRNGRQNGPSGCATTDGAALALGRHRNRQSALR